MTSNILPSWNRFDRCQGKGCCFDSCRWRSIGSESAPATAAAADGTEGVNIYCRRVQLWPSLLVAVSPSKQHSPPLTASHLRSGVSLRETALLARWRSHLTIRKASSIIFILRATRLNEQECKFAILDFLCNGSWD